MKSKIMIMLLPLALAACATTKDEPVPSGVTAVRVPELPYPLNQRATRLPDITDNTMGGQVEAGIEADTAYNDVAFRYNNLIDLYNCVKDAINNKQEVEECLSQR